MAFEEKSNFYIFSSCSSSALIMDKVAFLSERGGVMNDYLEFSRNKVLSDWLEIPQLLVQQFLLSSYILNIQDKILQK